jgi:hypothetical protein
VKKLVRSDISTIFEYYLELIQMRKALISCLNAFW